MQNISEPTGIVEVDEADALVPPSAVSSSPPPRDELAPASCPNCGAQFQGQFCSNCGEKRVVSEDYSLRRFLGEAFNILTSVESNLFRSFATLLTRPGRLTAEYFKGRRKSFLKPLQLFVFCNVIFFFAQTSVGFNSLTTPLYVHLSMLPHSRLASRMVDGELRQRQIAYADYRQRFDVAIEGQAKTLVIVMVPIFALLMGAFFWRTRRYYVEHLVFSTHFFAFFLLLVAALNIGLRLVWRGERIVGINLPVLQSDAFGTLVMLSICAVYLFVALGRVYGQGKIMRVFKCLALVACIMVVLQLYRFILFFTTFYTL